MKIAAALLGLTIVLTGCSTGATSQAQQHCVLRMVNDVFKDGTLERSKKAEAYATKKAEQFCAADQKAHPDAFETTYG